MSTMNRLGYPEHPGYSDDCCGNTPCTCQEPYEFRVTVEDLKTGERQVMEFTPGDYVLIPFGPCRRDGVQMLPMQGRQVITVSRYGPLAKARVISPEVAGG